MQKIKAQLTRVDEKGECKGPAAEIRIEDIQEIQVLQDKCQQLAHFLELDHIVLDGLYEHMASMSQDELDTPLLRSMKRDASIHIKRADRLLKRLEGTIALVSTIIATLT